MTSGTRSAFWYYLSGALGLLDEPGEWFYDGETLYLWAPDSETPQDVEVKVRNYAFDLSERSYITVKNIELFAATVTTSEASRGVVLDGINARYVSHYATLPDLPAERIEPGTDNFGLIGSHIHDSGIQLRGQDHTLTNSRVSFSAGNLVLLEGEGHEVSNSVLENSNYLSSYAASLQVAGRDHSILRNTVRGAGRSAVNVDWKLSGLSLPGVDFAYNDISQFATISTDVGAIYVCCRIDLEGTAIHHNWIHDARAFSPFWGTRGVYLDLDTHNSLIHHNVIWDITGARTALAYLWGPTEVRGKGFSTTPCSRKLILIPQLKRATTSS